MTAETAVAKVGVKTVVYGALLLAALIGLGVMVWIWRDYQALKTKDAAVESRQVTTDEIGDAATTATDTVQTVRIQVEQSRASQDRRYQEVIRNDKNSRAWADMPVDVGVRNSDADPLDRSKDN